MSGGLTPNSQTFLGWNKLMIDMSNIFFYPFSSLFRKKSKMSTTTKCLHSETNYTLLINLKKIITFMF